MIACARRALRALFIGCLAVLAACADQAGDSQVPAQAAPALWEIRGPGGQMGWLFGTVHALPEDVDWRGPLIDQALDQSDRLVVEIGNLGDSRAAARAFARLATNSRLPPLLKRVAPSDRPAVARLLASGGAQESQFSQTESWAAALALASMTSEFDHRRGVDRALLEEEIPVVSLETFEQQFSYFDRLAEVDQIALLLAVAEEQEDNEAEENLQAWLTGDLETLELEAENGMLADPELRQALLVDRNKAWSRDIAALLKRGDHPFVAVGAAHMLGDVGLPRLLQRQGYQVRRLQ